MDQALINAKYFAQVGLWPPTSTLDPEGWLSNFPSKDRSIALDLLERFHFISHEMTKVLLTSGFHNLSNLISVGDESRHAAWSSFRLRMLATHVEGDGSNGAHPTDSGNLMVRLARDALRIPESRIASPDVTLRKAIANFDYPVVFFDDFVGSGKQFISTWLRERDLGGGAQASFQQVFRDSADRAFYIPLVATETGVSNIVSHCKGIRLAPVHTIKSTANLIAGNSSCWQEDTRDERIEAIFRVSEQAGIRADKWKGHEGLGLALSFAHSTPDATLPIFYSRHNGWLPLVNRHTDE